jgi:ribose transport system permease protein
MSTLIAAMATRRVALGSRLLKEYAIIWVTVLLFVFLATTTTNFLSVANFRNVLDQQSTVLIVAALATLTIIAGGFDVSLSAIYTSARWLRCASRTRPGRSCSQSPRA